MLAMKKRGLILGGLLSFKIIGERDESDDLSEPIKFRLPIIRNFFLLNAEITSKNGYLLYF